MRKDIEHVPVHIWDWLEKKDFTLLTDEERQEVLQYFSPEEYTDLHTVRQSIKLCNPFSGVTGKEELKQELLERVRSSKMNRMVSLGEVAIWRAAAGVLFIISGTLALYMFSIRHANSRNGVMAITDTVYLNHDIVAQPVVIHDTFYIDAQKRTNKPRRIKQQSSPAYARTKPASRKGGSIPVTRSRRIETSEKNTKGNSLKDDSLVKKYSFVTL